MRLSDVHWSDIPIPKPGECWVAIYTSGHIAYLRMGQHGEMIETTREEYETWLRENP